MKKVRIILFILMAALLLSSVAFAEPLKKGSKGQAVKQLQLQLKKAGYFKGEITGYFGSETETALKKFQAKQKITSDGVAGTKTTKALNMKTTANKADNTAKKVDTLAVTNIKNTKNSDGVESLDWWSKASKIFTIGKKAKITDVKTGKSYYLVRTYGSNHADCEAATKNDTAIMKSIWGGSWNWDRRPIIVEIDGHKIAASITAMPHAGVDSKPASKLVSSRSGGYGRGQNLDKIKNNQMSGVVDVHFLNSRTHGSNKVDAKHQAAIKVAAGKK